MKKTILKISIALFIILITSCSTKNEKQDDAIPLAKNHVWYYFSDNGFEKTDLPQNAPEIHSKPWTEAVRITSASSAVIPENKKAVFEAYALVNKKGLLCFNENNIELFTDDSIFMNDTAESLIFSNGHPVFYLYRSTFFNENIEMNSSVHTSRPFLIEFDSESKIFYPLVSYENLNLELSSQITGCLWNGETWACSAKKSSSKGVEFSYFYWQPQIPLTELSPALGHETFLFKSLTEEKYKELNMPKSFDSAPEELKELLSSIPDKFSFHVAWRDSSGITPVSYYKTGTEDISLSAKAGTSFPSGYTTAVFSDGTTYIKKHGSQNSTIAFRLPLLPSGFSYGEMAVAGNTLYVAWEENSFFKTARAGFISVSLSELISNEPDSEL